MNINELTIGQAKELASIFATEKPAAGLNGMIGESVIIRTYSAGCWFGTLDQKAGNEVILKDARRMWRWKAARGISLSACAIYGISQSESKIVEPVKAVWLEAIEIIPCSKDAATSIAEANYVEAQ